MTNITDEETWGLKSSNYQTGNSSGKIIKEDWRSECCKIEVLSTVI